MYVILPSFLSQPPSACSNGAPGPSTLRAVLPTQTPLWATPSRVKFPGTDILVEPWDPGSWEEKQKWMPVCMSLHMSNGQSVICPCGSEGQQVHTYVFTCVFEGQRLSFRTFSSSWVLQSSVLPKPGALAGTGQERSSDFGSRLWTVFLVLSYLSHYLVKFVP